MSGRQGGQDGEPLDPDRLVAEMLHQSSEDLQPGDLLTPPIAPASLFHTPGEPSAAHQYGRWSNPTWDALEQALGALEQAEAVLFPSGMAAIAAVFFTQLRPGDRILLPSDGYGASRGLVDAHLKPYGIEPVLCATKDYDQQDFTGFAMIWAETPSNPGLDVCDLAAAVERAHTAGALLVADNTTATPLGQRVLDLGADIAVSSDTKAINGHSDALMGHVATRDGDLAQQIRDWRKLSGAIPGPFEAWQVHRGLETLELRLDRLCQSAGAIAARLVARFPDLPVRYPGLADDPSHPIASKQMLRYGGLISVTFPSAGQAERFLSSCRYLRQSTSFGGVHSGGERRQRWGDDVPDGFVRLSIGCEPLEPLWDAIEKATAAALAE